MMMLKFLFRIAKWLAMVAIALVALVVGIWFFPPDETLTADTQALLVPKPAGPDAENTYFAVFGIDAAIDRDAHETGRKIVASYVAHSQSAATPDAPFSYENILGDSAFRKRAKAAVCVDDTANCLELYRAQWTRLRGEIDESQPYLARYRALRATSQFVETLPPSLHAPMPNWSAVVHLSRLTDAKIAHEVAVVNTRQQALKELAAEIAFWTGMHADAELVLTKMIATNVLQQKFRLAGEIVAAHPEVVAQYDGSIAGPVVPLPIEAARIRGAMQGEIRIAATTLLEMKQHTATAGKKSTFNEFMVDMAVRLGAYKPNATVNLYLSQIEPGIRAMDAALEPAFGLSRGDGQLQDHRQDPAKIDPLSLRTFLYNPVGRILATISVPAFAEYSYRLRDLVAQSRLIEAQRRIVAAKVRRADVAAFLIELGPSLANPHTALPMDWNAKTGELGFDPLSNGVKLKRLGAARVIVPAMSNPGRSVK